MNKKEQKKGFFEGVKTTPSLSPDDTIIPPSGEIINMLLLGCWALSLSELADVVKDIKKEIAYPETPPPPADLNEQGGFIDIQDYLLFSLRVWLAMHINIGTPLTTLFVAADIAENGLRSGNLDVALLDIEDLHNFKWGAKSV